MMLIIITLVCWSIAVYMFWKWDLGGYRSEYEEKQRHGK